MQTVHWLGTGLSTVPGIRRLARGNRPLVLWNRTVSKAQEAVAGIDNAVDIRKFDIDALAAAVNPGDIVVSMLPGDWHVKIAELALSRGAHFVSSSYVSDEMQALDQQAKDRGLCLVNEVGLDPGIDHLMAHSLVHDYKNSSAYSSRNQVFFRSYCGGFPSIPNDFRYKFSWSPLGVLKALKSPSRSIRGGEPVDVQRPWHAITNYEAILPGGRRESFQAYPNRDALPFMSAYRFDPGWDVQEFVRGTLRLNGWSEAWKDIFAEIETLSGPAGDQRLREMSDELWNTQAYDPGEPDRVVLCVELEARADGHLVWHQSYTIDALGNANGTAMARLVSLTVSLAVDAVADGDIEPGVSAAPADDAIVQKWFSTLTELGEHIERIDHLA
jgi:saccharopine dehydrogenase (NADP+, L-glutamate forming)